MKVTTLSKKSTTMYEVDDGNLPKSYNIDSETKHYKPFYDFICSLGFDAHEEYPNSGMQSHMMIDGEEFHVDFSKSPYLATNGWSRETKPRKDRCIEIHEGHGDGYPLVIKVKFNQELDRDALVNKIQKAIDEKKAWRQKIIDRKNNEMRLLTLMRDHYYACPIISAYVEYIMVEKGILNFSIDGGTIIVDASTGVVKEFIPFEEEKNIKVVDISKWATNKSNTASRARMICSELENTIPVGKEFSEFSKGAYSRYVRKDRIEE
jgi:hypothetical protein